jgi:hypothetical protein
MIINSHLSCPLAFILHWLRFSNRLDQNICVRESEIEIELNLKLKAEFTLTSVEEALGNTEFKAVYWPSLTCVKCYYLQFFTSVGCRKWGPDLRLCARAKG